MLKLGNTPDFLQFDGENDDSLIHHELFGDPIFRQIMTNPFMYLSTASVRRLDCPVTVLQLQRPAVTKSQTCGPKMPNFCGKTYLLGWL